MRGLADPALWLLVPVLARAAEIATASASAGVQLRGTKNADFLSFRLDVFEATEPCGLNATVGGEPLVVGDASTFVLDDNLRASGSWKTLCLSEEVLLMMRIEEVMGLVVEGVDLTIRVKPTAPVEIFDIAGPAVLTHISDVDDDEDYDGPMSSALTWEDVTNDLSEDIADLQFLREMASELEREIQFKHMFLEQMADHEEEVQIASGEPQCDGFWCSLKGLFDRIIGLGHPGRGRWPGKGCNRTHGNHTHGNHTFPPPWWKHPHGNHTHGNHTHGNHTFPPPWWKHPHGNHTHGNGSHPHPPFRHRPPFFCRPHHRPGKPPHGPPHGPHGKPPHGKPPHGKPPHHGPPHGKPPHGGPPHGKPPGHPPFPWPTEYQNSAAVNQNQPHSLFYSLHPLVRTGILVTLFSLLVIALRARCRARWGHMTWAERREMRRARCRAKRAAMRRRFRAFLDRLRPDESDDEGENDFMCGVGTREKAGLLWEDAARGCQEGVVVSEKGEVVDEKEEFVDEKENAEEGMTMSEEISSFRDVANMVGEIIAAEEGRVRI